jgi:DNA ligase D-like protein (predicted 3'-phosphoesterase)
MARARKPGTRKRATAAASSARPRSAGSTRISANPASAVRPTKPAGDSAAVTTNAGRATKQAAKPARTTTKPARASAKTARAEKPARTKAKPARAPKPAATRAAKAGARGRVTHAGRPSGDKLAVYRSKRDFGRTPEPEGGSPGAWKKTGNPYFVIQKHAASRLHYDFRLEVDGVLKSWAVPKGPSMDPAVKRLAVEVEDHPVEYADFEGIIPKDEYGGGTVIVWDAGPYRNIKTKAGEAVPMSVCHGKGQVEVWLEGKKIRGGFALVHTRMDEKGKNWLLLKMKDEAVDGSDPVSERVESVISGRTIEEVAGKPKRVWSSR